MFLILLLCFKNDPECLMLRETVPFKEITHRTGSGWVPGMPHSAKSSAILINSGRAGQAVKVSLSRYLTRRLKLAVDEAPRAASVRSTSASSSSSPSRRQTRLIG